jgi:hypothetical protein
MGRGILPPANHRNKELHIKIAIVAYALLLRGQS